MKSASRPANRPEEKISQRKWPWVLTLTRTLGLALALALIPSIYYAPGPALATDFSPTTTPPRCTLNVLTGGVEVWEADAADWEPGINGMTLDAGTKVQTSSISQAMLIFFDGSTLLIEANTAVEIRQVESNQDQSITIILKQWFGRTWSRVVKMLEPGSHYEIQTPSAVAVVRGTMFSTEVDETGTTIVQTREGLVSVSAQGNEVYLPPGLQTIVEPGKSPSEPEKVKPSNGQSKNSSEENNSGKANNSNQSSNSGQSNNQSKNSGKDSNQNSGSDQGNNQSIISGNDKLSGKDNNSNKNKDSSGNNDSSPSPGKGNSSNQGNNPGHSPGQGSNPNQGSNSNQGNSSNQGNNPPGHSPGQGSNPNQGSNSNQGINQSPGSVQGNGQDSRFIPSSKSDQSPDSGQSKNQGKNSAHRNTKS